MMEVGIVGMGFCGMMTAVHLINQSTEKISIHIFNGSDKPGFGPAYQTRCTKHLLNIRAGNMGCTEAGKNDFVEWICHKPVYNSIDKKLISDMFLPRMEYGEYLQHVWNKTWAGKKENVTIILHNETVINGAENGEKIDVFLQSGKTLQVDKLVLATGNETPASPRIKNQAFYNHPCYLSNPWNYDALEENNTGDNILIIGNGLTMADVVLAVHDKKFNGTIYALSPHGFTILPHRHNGTVYTALRDELKEPFHLIELFTLFRKHIRFVRQFGLSAEPVVDSIRAISSEIWMKLSLEDKKRFMRHIRHLWGLARHRLPAHIHDFLYELRVNNKLKILKGRLVDINDTGHELQVDFYNRHTKTNERITVNRVINCTGPQTNIRKSSNPLLVNMAANGTIQPDELEIGIHADSNGAVINSQGKKSSKIFTLGGNLRGLLWETTAVPELRVQAEKLAEYILKN